MTSSIPDHHPTSSVDSDAGNETNSGTPAGGQPVSAYTHLVGGLDESGTYLLTHHDGNWIARAVVPLITDDLDDKGQLVLEVIHTPAILRDTMHPAARQHIDGVCRLRDLNTYGMADEFGDPRGSDYPEPVRATAADLLATIWMATWRYGISSTEWYEVASLPWGCLDMADHLASRPKRHAAADEGS